MAKMCKTCGEVLPTDQYYKIGKYFDPHCRNCRKAMRKRAYEARKNKGAPGALVAQGKRIIEEFARSLPPKKTKLMVQIEEVGTRYRISISRGTHRVRNAIAPYESPELRRTVLKHIAENVPLARIRPEMIQELLSLC